MKVLILNGALKDDKIAEAAGRIAEEVLSGAGYETETIMLREETIGECLGCFGCWVKTPGICVIDDFGRSVAEKYINSDAVIWIIPVVYGGYSSEFKKAQDRLIPLILPFFSKIQGEVHHKKRYDSYPRVVVIGTMCEGDEVMEGIFNNLIKRNSLNLFASFSGGTVIGSSEEEIKSQIKEKLEALEVAVC